MRILRSQMVVAWSWGFHSAYLIPDGLEFSVEGFLFKGTVQVIYDRGSDTFSVRLMNEDGAIKEEHADIYLDNLVDTIDRAVERGGSESDYRERVDLEYFK